MRPSRFVLAGIVLACVLARHVSADTQPTLEQAIQRATESGKPLLVEFYADWCGPCRQFEQTTMPDARVQQALGAVTFIRYNAEQAPGDDVASRFDVDSYPTFVAIDRAGAERLRYEGSLLGESGIKRFIDLIGEARASVEDEAAIKTRLAAAPNQPEVRLAAARWYAMHGKPDLAVHHFDAVARSPTAATLRSEAWGAAARIRRIEKWRRQLVDEKVERIRRFPADAEPDDLAIATVGSGLSLEEVRSIFAIVMLRQDDASGLNGAVYAAIAAGALDEALFGANKAVALRRDARHLDTLAEVHHARGEKSAAVRVAAEAFALDKGSNTGVLRLNQKRFETGKGDAREVRQLRLRTADLWKRAEQTVDVLAKRVRDPDDERQQNQVRAETRQAMDAERKLERDIAAACQPDAGSVEQALVRATLDKAGRIATSVQLHEPGATDALRRCIDRQLADATLPGAAQRKKRSLSLSFAAKH